jgi:hypothetical protein
VVGSVVWLHILLRPYWHVCGALFKMTHSVILKSALHWTLNSALHWTLNNAPHWTLNSALHWTLNSALHWTLNIAPHWTLNSAPHWTLNSALHWTLGNTHNISQLYTKIYCGIIKTEKRKIIDSLSMMLYLSLLSKVSPQYYILSHCSLIITNDCHGW